MGPTSAARRFRITLRLTQTERRQLSDAAVHSGLTLSAYARAVLVQAKPLRAARRPAVEAVLLARMLARLGVIASALGDIAKVARHAGSEVTLMPSLERELARCLRELRPCRSQLMRALGRKASPT
jgi:uncharacterized protein (DUF1778 family)